MHFWPTFDMRTRSGWPSTAFPHVDAHIWIRIGNYVVACECSFCFLLFGVCVSASDAVRPHGNILSHKSCWFLSPKYAGHVSGLRMIFGCVLKKLLKMLGTCQHTSAAVCHVPAAVCKNMDVSEKIVFGWSGNTVLTCWTWKYDWFYCWIMFALAMAFAVHAVFCAVFMLVFSLVSLWSVAVSWHRFDVKRWLKSITELSWSFIRRQNENRMRIEKVDQKYGPFFQMQVLLGYCWFSNGASGVSFC